MGTRVASALWRITPRVVLALDGRLGPPVDSYVNGAQTWLPDDGDQTFEWRLHPVSGFTTPSGLSHYDVWEQVVARLSADVQREALPLGDETRALTNLWDGLECFVAFGNDVEPANLARHTTAVLGIPPELCGLVDHEVVGDRWEQANGQVSIVQLLADQLESRGRSSG